MTWSKTRRTARALPPHPSLGARLSTLAAALVWPLLLAGASAGLGSGRLSSAGSHLGSARVLIQSAIKQEDLGSGQLAQAGSAITEAEREIGAASAKLGQAESEVGAALAAEEISSHESSEAGFDLQRAIHLDAEAKDSLGNGKRRAAIEYLHDAERFKQSALDKLPAVPATPPTGPTKYTYDVKIEVAATGDNFVDSYGVPGTHPTYSGGMSASYSIVFPVVFTVDEKAQTVDAEPMASTSGSGTDSFALTWTDPGQHPSTDTCKIPTRTPFKAVGALAPAWGGGPDARSYDAGVMHFTLSVGPAKTRLYPCSASTPTTIINVTVQSGLTLPGTNLQYVDTPPSTNPAYPNPGCVSGNPTDIYVPIPISDLGRKVATTTFRPGPLACQATVLDAFYTAHVVYAITLELQGAG